MISTFLSRPATCCSFTANSKRWLREFTTSNAA
ncbi:Uncharacterised protein [Vibrio cholerae]|nr:Uncharacterised protein [Vibrio cholerae]